MNDSKTAASGWHHAPVHKLDGRGAYMVTCGTLQKIPVLTTPERLSDFQSILFEHTGKFGWQVQAWAVMSNNYHWIGLSPEKEADAQSMKVLVTQLHEVSAKHLNRLDGVTGRRVWCNYWESRITFQTSYLARLKYVHDNPAHHGVVMNAAAYAWCSRAWLERTASQAFVKQLDSFKTNTLNVPDDF